MKNLNPPKWAPYAVATDQGWVNPKTGELLVSLRGLKSKISENNPVILPIEPPEEVLVESTFIEITVDPIKEEVPKEPENPKKTRSRSRKSSSGQ